MVVYLQARYTISQRRACGLASISRKAMRYRSVRAELDQPLVQRLKELAERYPRYGYLMLHALLKAESLVINRKRTYRLYRQQGLQVRMKRRKKLIRPRIVMPIPTQPNDSWSADFVHDQLADGRRIRVLNIVDDYSRVCVSQLLDTSISGLRVARLLEELATSRGLPQRLTLDNGTEFTSKAMFLWSRASGVKLNFIQPGKPTQNAFVESFNGKFRDSCLNQHWIVSLEEARRTIDQWRNHYNHERPHSSLNYTPPACFEAQAA